MAKKNFWKRKPQMKTNQVVKSYQWKSSKKRTVYFESVRDIIKLHNANVVSINIIDDSINKVKIGEKR